MEQTILRKDVYDALQSGEPFDIQFITCDRRRATGGELVTATGWMKIQKDATHQAAGPGTGPRSGALTPSRNCNHEENGTVNIFNPANSGVHPITVHIDLIVSFNNKRVIN